VAVVVLEGEACGLAAGFFAGVVCWANSGTEARIKVSAKVRIFMKFINEPKQPLYWMRRSARWKLPVFLSSL
jgi:hypothetical protein